MKRQSSGQTVGLHSEHTVCPLGSVYFVYRDRFYKERREMKRGKSLCSFVSVYCFPKASSSYTHSLPAVPSGSLEYSVIAAGYYHYFSLLTSDSVVVHVY